VENSWYASGWEDSERRPVGAVETDDRRPILVGLATAWILIATIVVLRRSLVSGFGNGSLPVDLRHVPEIVLGPRRPRYYAMTDDVAARFL
jgi:hypothetical protein